MINEFRVTSLDESSFPLWCGGRARRSVELQFNPENLCDRGKKNPSDIALDPVSSTAMEEEITRHQFKAEIN